MELRELEAFVAVATELHFGRAAERLHMGQPTVSELVRRLERDVGAPLLTRTTRRVALTGAGHELLGRAKVILDEVASAAAAVKRVTRGDSGKVRLGVTPPVSPALEPHLRDGLGDKLPDIDLVVRRMWLPDLAQAVADGAVDVAITCGVVDTPPGVVNEIFCGEPLLVGLRPGHRLAGQDAIDLTDLANDRLGVPDADLFPAWALAQRQSLQKARISPPTVVLKATDLNATAWTTQSDVDWILMTASIAPDAAATVSRPVSPAQCIPYTLQWNPERAQTAAIARFVHYALITDVPEGWQTEQGHLRHAER
jgi:DNA-binding transcriptional LysR family regulator